MKASQLYICLAVMAVFTFGMDGIRAQEEAAVAPPAVLLKTALDRFQGQEVEILRLEFAPGWVGTRHFHPGELFVYVLDGAFIIRLAGEPAQSFDQGSLIRELPGQVLSAANASSTEPVSILVVHLAGAGEPLLVEVE